MCFHTWQLIKLVPATRRALKEMQSRRVSQTIVAWASYQVQLHLEAKNVLNILYILCLRDLELHTVSARLRTKLKRHLPETFFLVVIKAFGKGTPFFIGYFEIRPAVSSRSSKLL